MGIAYKNHKVFPNNIYYRDFKGTVNVREIIMSWEFLLNNDLIKEETKGIINNLNDCELDMDMDSFQTLMNYLKAHAEFKHLKLAVICTDPRKIVFPVLGEKMEKTLKIKPFASEDAAVSWIMEF